MIDKIKFESYLAEKPLTIEALEKAYSLLNEDGKVNREFEILADLASDNDVQMISRMTKILRKTAYGKAAEANVTPTLVTYTISKLFSHIPEFAEVKCNEQQLMVVANYIAEEASEQLKELLKVK